MIRIISTSIIAMLLLCFGCTINNTYLQPTAECYPLSAFDTIVISPFNSDSVFIEEEQYKQLPRDIALLTTEKLKDRIENNHLFNKVIQSSDCADNAIRIDGRVYSLTHHKGDFHAGIRGQIINCQNGKILYKFDSDERDSESIILPGQIAEKLTDAIKAKLICEKPK